MSCHVHQVGVTVPRAGGSEHVGLNAIYHILPGRCVPLSTAGCCLSMGSSHEYGDHALAGGNPVYAVRLSQSLSLKPLRSNTTWVTVCKGSPI